MCYIPSELFSCRIVFRSVDYRKLPATEARVKERVKKARITFLQLQNGEVGTGHKPDIYKQKFKKDASFMLAGKC
jgi:hypothetical protein